MKLSNDVKNVSIVFLIVIFVVISGFTYVIYELNNNLRDDYTNKLLILNKNVLSNLNNVKTDLEDDIDDINTNLSIKLTMVENNLNSFRSYNKKEIKTLNNLIEEIETQSDIKLNELKDEVNSISVESGDFTAIVEDVLESVVSIGTNTGVGSGAIIDDEGYIVTNYHVVKGARIIRVLTYDGTVHDAIFVGYEPNVDVAVLKIDDSNLEILQFDDSEDVKVGEKVIALGNPAGLSFSVTEGIVSAVNRRGPNNLNIYLQTDVPINPGNSGGPLVNTNGKIIGINNYKIGGFEGLGFAIESDTVEEISEGIIEQFINNTS